jgi:hypothetical protein
VDDKPSLNADLIDAARNRIGAAARDRNAALDVIRYSVVSLRDLLRHGMTPDPERTVYLGALLEALEQIEQGTDARDALHLRPSGRVRDETLLARDLLTFVRIGQRIDELEKRGDTRGDGPVAQAQREIQQEIAKAHRQSPAKVRGQSLAKVRKVWTAHGAMRGWDDLRDLWSNAD